jgi:molecular chaperone GrpE
MGRKHADDAHKARPVEPTVDGQPSTVDGPDDAPQAAELEASSGTAVAEPLEQALARLERELAEWKDRALRAAADFDNFRKRATREREEQYGRGQSEAYTRIVEVIDDLARVAHLDPAATSAPALHEGMLQIERKFLKLLEVAGLERVDPAGQPFDPNVAEAVMTLPAPSAEQDHMVGAVYQHGYRFRGMLLRPARVAVFTWQGPPPGEAEAAQ